MVDTILPNVGVLIFDAGNDNPDEDSIVLYAARQASSFILPFTADDPVTARNLEKTIRWFGTDTEDLSETPEKLAEKRAIGIPHWVPMWQKLARATLVASKVTNSKEIDVDNWNEDRRWLPESDEPTRAKGYRNWKKAVARTLDWIDFED